MIYLNIGESMGVLKNEGKSKLVVHLFSQNYVHSMLVVQKSLETSKKNQ